MAKEKTETTPKPKDKGVDNFKRVIENFLKKKAFQDPLFRPVFQKENKNIDDCVNYIFSVVKKSGKQGFPDEDIFNMAIHYYDEDDIDIKNVTIPSRIIVNEDVKLTPEEIEQAREEARKKVIDEEMARMRGKTTQKSKENKKVPLPDNTVKPGETGTLF